MNLSTSKNSIYGSWNLYKLFKSIDLSVLYIENVDHGRENQSQMRATYDIPEWCKFGTKMIRSQIMFGTKFMFDCRTAHIVTFF